MTLIVGLCLWRLERLQVSAIVCYKITNPCCCWFNLLVNLWL